MPFLKELSLLGANKLPLHLLLGNNRGSSAPCNRLNNHLKNVLILRIPPKIFLIAKCSVVSLKNFSNNLIKQMKLRNCQTPWSTRCFTKIPRLACQQMRKLWKKTHSRPRAAQPPKREVKWETGQRGVKQDSKLWRPGKKCFLVNNINNHHHNVNDN